MEFVKAHKALVAAMSSRINYEFIMVEIDDKEVFASPTQFIDDWNGFFKNVKFYRDKGYSVKVLKGEVDINIK